MGDIGQGFKIAMAVLDVSRIETAAAAVSRALTYRSIDALTAQGRATQEIAVAKYYATEAAVRNANRAIQIHGGYGYLEEFEVERLARDARVLTLYEGTSEIMKLLIAGQHTGIKAFQ